MMNDHPQSDGPHLSCDLDDCSCTGKNLGKFTSPAALLAIAEADCLSGYDIAAGGYPSPSERR